MQAVLAQQLQPPWVMQVEPAGSAEVARVQSKLKRQRSGSHERLGWDGLTLDLQQVMLQRFLERAAEQFRVAHNQGLVQADLQCARQQHDDQAAAAAKLAAVDRDADSPVGWGAEEAVGQVEDEFSCLDLAVDSDLEEKVGEEEEEEDVMGECGTL